MMATGQTPYDSSIRPLRAHDVASRPRRSTATTEEILVALDDCRRDNLKTQQLLTALQAQLAKLRHAIDDIAGGVRTRPRASP